MPINTKLGEQCRKLCSTTTRIYLFYLLLQNDKYLKTNLFLRPSEPNFSRLNEKFLLNSKHEPISHHWKLYYYLNFHPILAYLALLDHKGKEAPRGGRSSFFPVSRIVCNSVVELSQPRIIISNNNAFCKFMTCLYRIIHEMDIQEPEFTSEQVRSVLFTQDAGNQCKFPFTCVSLSYVLSRSQPRRD